MILRGMVQKTKILEEKLHGQSPSDTKSFASSSNRKGRETLISEFASDDEAKPDERAIAKQKIRAMEKAEKILSKYKNAIHDKINVESGMSWLVFTITRIISTPDKLMKRQHYKFENSREAAKFNTKLLKKSRYDLTSALV